MHKRQHVERARTLLATGDNADLPYAALELRMAMEAITYDKLRAHAARLPAEVLDRWQPPQAMKALLQFEPSAGRNFVVRVAPQPTVGVPGTQAFTLGEHRSFDLGWLRPSYNKLGSYLHVPSPKQSASRTTDAATASRREALQTILVEVERVAGARLEGGMASVIQFDCDKCERLVLCNEEAVRETKRAVCLEPSCSAEHFAEFASDGCVTFYLDAMQFDCLKCKAAIPVETRRLAIGWTFRCDACSAPHVLRNTHWEYAIHEPSQQSARPGA